MILSLSLLYSAFTEYFVGNKRETITRFFNDKLGKFIEFVPTPFAPYAIQQMLLSRILPFTKVEWTKVLTTFDDGTVCRLDINNAAVSLKKQEDKVVLLCHGFGGSVESPYCSHFANFAREQGYTTIVYNRRAHVPESKSPTYPLHYEQGDLENVIDWIKDAYPLAELSAVGCSMGGNLLIKYAGITGTECPFKRVISVSNGFNLDAGVELSKKMSLNNRLFMSFTREILCNVEGGDKVCSKIGSFSELEGKALETFNKSPSNQSMPDYYYANSSITEVANVTVPLLCIYSDDDILLQHDDEFYKKIIATNPNTTIIVTSHGGHTGFVDRDFKCDWWVKNAILFLQSDASVIPDI